MLKDAVAIAQQGHWPGAGGAIRGRFFAEVVDFPESCPGPGEDAESVCGRGLVEVAQD